MFKKIGIWLSVLAVVALLLTPTTINAGGCRSYIYYPQQFCYYPTYEKIVVREIVAPVAVPVLVPATVFQYLPAVQPAAQVFAQPIVQPAAVQQPVATNGNGNGNGKLNISNAELDRLIRERLEAILRERMSTSDDGPPPLQGAAPAQPPAQDQQTRVLNLLANACARCHTKGENEKGNTWLFVKDDGKLFYQPNATPQKMIEEIESGRMPKGGNNITGNDLADLKQWLLTTRGVRN